MTAADALSVQPAPRPEPAAAKAAAPARPANGSEEKSFADVLGAETVDVRDETADAASNDVPPADLAAGTLPTQPAPPPITPAAAWSSAILAGLNPDALRPEGVAETSRIDGAKPAVAPELTLDEPSASVAAPNLAAPTVATPTVAPAIATPAVATTTATTPDAPTPAPESQPSAQDFMAMTAAAPAAAAATPAKPAVKTVGRTDHADAPEDAVEGSPTDNTGDADPMMRVTPDAPAQLLALSPASATAPTTAPDMKTAAASAPGAERAAAAIAPASTPTAQPGEAKVAAASAEANPQISAARLAQAGAATADAAPEIKGAAPTSGASATPVGNALTGTPASGEAGKAAQAPSAPQSAPAAAVQVSTRMIERFDGRAQRYEIRLDPEELGRVDVRIEVGADKKVHAVLAAHDSAALSDLMRGQRSLEAALKQAGVDVADGGIKFELSSDNGRNTSNGANQGDTSGKPNGSNVWRGFSAVNVAVDTDAAAAARPWRTSRLDVVA